MLTKELTHAEALAWWEKKTPEQKLQTIGVEVIDKWVLEIINSNFGKSSNLSPENGKVSVTKLLSK